jgi:prophage regulatory protein
MRLIRRPELERKIGLSKSVIYEMMRDRSFPMPVRLTSKSVAWVEAEVDAWCAALPRARDNNVRGDMA